MVRMLSISRPLVFLLLLGVGVDSFSQGKLYTARGYWEETTQSNYRAIKQKIDRGDSVTEKERNYVNDYEAFLNAYFQRLSEEEKLNFQQMKTQWDAQPAAISRPSGEEEAYDLRGRDRLSNGLYGLYYGISIVAIGELSGAAAGGIPLITTGLWTMGPALNQAKYKGITRSTVLAGNAGKALGLVNGIALGLAVAGNSDSGGKVVLGLSTIGSIALGEAAFQIVKKKKLSAGHVQMMRHYGFLGPWLGYSLYAASGSSEANLAGVALLTGGVTGLIVGSKVARTYDYTRGDVEAISSLTLISTGLGFTAIAESFKNDGSRALILVPAVASLVGTLAGQHAVRGAQLTEKQGSTLNLSVAGAALVGLGVVTLTKSNSPAVWIGVPSGLALITHQVIFHGFKKENIELNFQGSYNRQRKYHVALQVTPESYFINQQIPAKDFTPQAYAMLQSPLFRLSVSF